VSLIAGTSGFSYPGWRGVFYPDGLSGGRMLAYYSERLKGVELNGSFYRTPPESSLAKWAGETPESFRFCFKGARGLTYSAAQFDKVGLAEQVGRRLAVLGPRLGPILLQWPPTQKRDEGLLDAVLEALGLATAVEFRDPSWFVPKVEAVLARRGAAMVVTDEEKWPMAPRTVDGPTGYYRLRRDYDGGALRPWAARLGAESREREVHVYFKHEPEAPGRALRLLELAEAV
jgi:uncharacterized protein YecE (DUF72 family)